MRLNDHISMTREQARAAVESCNDLELLVALFREADDSARDLRDDISCFRHAGTASDDWLRRAGSRLASTTKLRRWVESRILELGGEAPWPPSDPRNRRIYTLEARLREVTAALVAAGLQVPGREVVE